MTRYHWYLVVVAFFGWTFLWFEFHLVSVLAPVILPALHLSYPAFGSIISISFGVSVIFSLIAGPLIDRYGRKTLFQLTMLGTALFSGLQYFITGFGSWAAIRSLVQMFTFSEQGVAATLLTESVPAKRRGALIGIVQAGFPAGLAIAGLVGAFVLPAVGWRATFLLSMVPALIVVAIRIWVREPERFVQLRALRQALQREDRAQVAAILAKYPVALEKAQSAPYAQLFAPDLRRTTWVLAIWSFVNAGIGIAALSFLPTYLHVAKHLSVSLSSLIVTVVGFWAVVGYVSAGFLGDRYGRREISIWYAAVGVVGLALALGTGSLAGVIVGLLVWGFGNNGMFSCLTALLAEAFPTRVRGTGSAFIEAAFGIGAAAFPILFGTAIGSWGFTATYWILAVVPYALVIAVFALWMRRIPPASEVESIAT